MEQGLQKLNADQRLAVWTQRIADCRSSGKGRQTLVPGEQHFGENVLLLAEKSFQNGAGSANSGVC